VVDIAKSLARVPKRVVWWLCCYLVDLNWLWSWVLP